MSARTIHTQSFESYTYLRFNAWRAKYCLRENKVILQKLTTHWNPMVAAEVAISEWQDVADFPCNSNAQAEQLFLAYLDEAKVPHE